VSGALLSDDGAYRYRLWRGAGRSMLFVMLNPSTADASADDPTIRRCVSFAAREGCTRIDVINLFALRATDPKALAAHADPVGPDNRTHTDEALSMAVHCDFPIVAAWGAHGFAVSRAVAFAQAAARLRAPLLCLGTTKDGAPRHPLYVRADAPLVVWSPRS
jgi:hypothetical protein